ncbi:MAG: hypothetical protein RSC91_00935 [Clostridia bacterium]
MPNDALRHGAPVLPFGKPAEYWIRRAERSRQNGDFRRASVLLRHAAGLEPAAPEPRLEYAASLREMNCFEASNREAFAALAEVPDFYRFFALIGRNMAVMGRREEAMDAFALYLSGARADDAEPLPWDDEAYEIDDAFEEDEPTHRNRLQTLLSICARRLLDGELPKARRLLERLDRTPLKRLRAQTDALHALYEHSLGHENASIRFARNAMRKAPSNVRIAVAMCDLLAKQQQGLMALLALMRTLICARTAQDEYLACTLAERYGCLPAAAGMLRRNLQRLPNRLPTCYNLCTCLLKLGELPEAMRLAHLCRELDPDDVPTRRLFEHVLALEEKSTAPHALLKDAASLLFYGAMNAEDVSACLTPIAEALQNGLQPFAQELQSNRHLRRDFLFALTLPLETLSQMLGELAAQLPKPFAEALLREALVFNPGGNSIKRAAAAALVRIGAPPPYTVWYDGHIAQVNPIAPQPRVASFMQRMLAHRLYQAQALIHEPEVIVHGMRLINRMSRPQRLRVAADPSGTWPIALCIHYRRVRGYEPPSLAYRRFNKARVQALLRALRTLNRV